ncbi:hypothetical protein M422DRAFT_60420 [Sphaerobolus stellatus SS14]|uniref:Cytochrome P450 n=1 Tax=Sphaerobolus stellatus (strain SS14) TaxID=990650 RepID=A0A0C9UER1_SPHS4|nr:hypothetical protein M422DRAFT_60420 [Sphaerobolus stellatus SS14]
MSTRKPTSFEKTVPDYRRRIVWIFSIPLKITIRSGYAMWVQDKESRQLNTKPIPRIQGRLPGNLDIEWRVMKSFKGDYILQGFADLPREHNTTILNTRFFWDDQIISMDEGVTYSVFFTGFSHLKGGYSGINGCKRVICGGHLINYSYTYAFSGFFEPDYSMEDNAWKKSRAIARPFFSKDHISDVDIFERTSIITLDLFAVRSNKGRPIDIQDLVSRFTLDSASEFLFGRRLDTLSRPLTEPGKVKLGLKGSILIDRSDEFDVFTEAFGRVAVLMTQRGAQGPTWPLLELFKDLTEEPIQVIMNWLDPLVKVTLKKKMKSLGTVPETKDAIFLDFLASQTDDFEHIRYELVTYLIASRDTTETLLTFIIYFFALYPNVCERLREEILTTFGPDQPPSYDKLKGLKYLHRWSLAHLVMFPPVIPTSNRPIHFPRRTQRYNLWEKNEDEFLPERWLDEKTLTNVNSTPFMYCPFSGGPRNCIGQGFAFNETAYFLVRLLQRFKAFKFAPRCQPTGSLPDPVWKRKPGRQSAEQIVPAINMTIHSKSSD